MPIARNFDWGGGGGGLGTDIEAVVTLQHFRGRVGRRLTLRTKIDLPPRTFHQSQTQEREKYVATDTVMFCHVL